MPAALGLIALRFAWTAAGTWRGRLAAMAAIGAAFALGLAPGHAAALKWVLGPPASAAASFLACATSLRGRWVAWRWFLFFADGTPVSAVSAEVYRLIASPTLPAIPLLTAAGYVLAESGASSRLVRFFRAVFGWMPGGMAVMVAAVCAVVHHLHRRLRHHDHRLGRAGLSDPAGGRLPRGFLARPGDGGGQPRAALSAEPAGRPLQRRGEPGLQPGRAGGVALHRRAGARPAPRCAGSSLRHHDRTEATARAAAFLVARGEGSRVGGEMGVAAAGLRDRRIRQRRGLAGRNGGRRRAPTRSSSNA